VVVLAGIDMNPTARSEKYRRNYIEELYRNDYAIDN
jgi:hypothetical protein